MHGTTLFMLYAILITSYLYYYVYNSLTVVNDSPMKNVSCLMWIVYTELDVPLADLFSSTCAGNVWSHVIVDEECMLDNVYTVSLYFLLCENIYRVTEWWMSVTGSFLLSLALNLIIWRWIIELSAIFTSANPCFLKRHNLILFNVIYFARLVKKRQA